MYAEIVTATVMLGCLLCIIHSWRNQDIWFTVAFFVGGFVFGIVRENIVSMMGTLYTYPDHPLYIGSAPLMMGFGWSASFYASWVISDRILDAFAPGIKERWWGSPLFSAIVTGLLSIPVEVAAGAPQTQWWVWPSNVVLVMWEMPALVPFGWAGAAFLFLFFFQRVMARGHSRENALLFIVTTLLVIVLHLTYVFAVRTAIVAVAGL